MAVTDSIKCLIGLFALLGHRKGPAIFIGVQNLVDVPPTPPPKGQTLPAMDAPPPPPPKDEVLHALDVAPVHPPEQQASYSQAFPLVSLPIQQNSRALVPYEVFSDDYPD